MTASAQATTNTITGAQLQGVDESRYLHLSFKLPAAASPTADAWFGHVGSPGTSLINYKIYTVTDQGTSHPIFTDVTASYVDQTDIAHSCIDQVPCPYLDALAGPGPATRHVHVLQIQTFPQDAIVPLQRPLSSKLTYLVEITDANHDRLDAQITPTAGIVSYDAKHVRNAIKITSNINLADVYASPVTVVYAPYPGKTVPFPARVLTPTPPDGIVLWLDSPLPAGTSNPLQISIQGIKDRAGSPDDVSVSGTLASAPTAPTLASKAFVAASFSAIAAVHSAPTFSATGSFAPLHVASTTVFLPGQIRFDPTVTFDVGSASAKTTNAVTLPSQFIRPFLLKQTHLPTTLAELNATKPSHVTVVNPMFGPRFEFDTQYGGTNTMGEGRVELYVSSLFRTTDITTARVAAANPSLRSTLNLPANGFSITPYFQYDGGGHVTQQSIANTTGTQLTVTIPTYSISRAYLGLQATAQLGRNTFAIDGSYVDLFDSETVPYTVSSTVSSRSISGWQPHFKGTYSVNIDQAGHFAGSLAWEDGRSAPSFQYLNKVTVGITVMY